MNVVAGDENSEVGPTLCFDKALVDQILKVPPCAVEILFCEEVELKEEKDPVPLSFPVYRHRRPFPLCQHHWLRHTARSERTIPANEHSRFRRIFDN